MEIPVIIPHYRKPEQLARCLEHLAAQTAPCLPIIEDNNIVNRGYTRAVNDGLRGVGDVHRYAIVLNQDAYLAPDAVRCMVEFMDAHPRCAIGGVKQVFASDPDLIYHGGGADVLPVGTHHGYGGRISNGDCSHSRRVGWVNGACQIVRMSTLPEIGLMDESMFLSGSDADWCITAALRGFEVWYIADALCLHEVGVSVKQPSEAVTAIMAKDMAYLTNKLRGLVAANNPA